MKGLIAKLFSRKVVQATKQESSQTPVEKFLEVVKLIEEDKYGRVAWPVLILDEGTSGNVDWRIKWSPALLAAWAVKCGLEQKELEQVAEAVERKLGELRITCEVLQNKTEMFRGRLERC